MEEHNMEEHNIEEHNMEEQNKEQKSSMSNPCFRTIKFEEIYKETLPHTLVYVNRENYYYENGNWIYDCVLTEKQYAHILSIGKQYKITHTFNTIYSTGNFQLKVYDEKHPKCYTFSCRVCPFFIESKEKLFYPLITHKEPHQIQEFPSYNKYDLIEHNEVYKFYFDGTPQIKFILKNTNEETTNHKYSCLLLKIYDKTFTAFDKVISTIF